MNGLLVIVACLSVLCDIGGTDGLNLKALRWGATQNRFECVFNLADRRRASERETRGPYMICPLSGLHAMT